MNSLTSLVVHRTGYWLDGDRKNNGNRTKVFLDEKLNSGALYRVWIEYFNSQLRVTMAPDNIFFFEREYILHSTENEMQREGPAVQDLVQHICLYK